MADANQIPQIGISRTIQQMMEQRQYISTNEMEEDLRCQKDYHDKLQTL